jgi:hypothetical protein
LRVLLSFPRGKSEPNLRREDRSMSQPSVAQQPGKPGVSLSLGIFGLIAWIIPIVGLPVTITGLVFGIKALKREEISLAVVGTALCAIGLLLSVGNAVVGAYLGATGRL